VRLVAKALPISPLPASWRTPLPKRLRAGDPPAKPTDGRSTFFRRPQLSDSFSRGGFTVLITERDIAAFVERVRRDIRRFTRGPA